MENLLGLTKEAWIYTGLQKIIGDNMSEVDNAEDDYNFLDKDHVVFYIDSSGNLKCTYTMFELENFQDLVMSILSGQLNDYILTFLAEDLSKKGMTQESISMVVVKNLLKVEDKSLTPIMKPSNFK